MCYVLRTPYCNIWYWNYTWDSSRPWPSTELASILRWPAYPGQGGSPNGPGKIRTCITKEKEYFIIYMKDIKSSSIYSWCLEACVIIIDIVIGIIGAPWRLTHQQIGSLLCHQVTISPNLLAHYYRGWLFQSSDFPVHCTWVHPRLSLPPRHSFDSCFGSMRPGFALCSFCTRTRALLCYWNIRGRCGRWKLRGKGDRCR